MVISGLRKILIICLLLLQIINPLFYLTRRINPFLGYAPFLCIITTKKGYTLPTINTKKICNKHGGFYDSTLSRSCPLCTKQSNKQYENTMRKQDIKKIYNSKAWATVRQKALIRDNFLCIPCCKQGIETRADEVHHIIEVQDDIRKAYDLENLESICHKCHMKLHYGEKK